MSAFLSHIRDENWDEAQKLLKRVKKPQVIGYGLRMALTNPDVPAVLVDELITKWRARQGGGQMKKTFYRDLLPTVNSPSWSDRSDELIRMYWFEVCRLGSPSTLQVLMDKYDSRGRIPPERSRITSTIHAMWRSYFVLFDDAPSRREALQEYKTYSQAGLPSFRYKNKDANEQRQHELLSVSTIEDMQQLTELRMLWEKTKILLKVKMAEDSAEGGEFNILHAMILTKCPRFLIWLGLRLYPDQVRKRDQKGCLPLHYAASIDTETDDLNVSFDEEVLNTPVLELILRLFSAGAGHHDADGRLPLSLLLDGDCPIGTDWYIGTCDIVSTFLHAEPRALVTRDMKSHMFPFMVAASGGKSLDTVYTLLREDPSAISSAIKDSPSEKYLKKKLSEAESTVKTMQKEMEALREEKEDLQKEIALLREENKKLKPTQKRSSCDPPAGLDSKRTRLS